MLSQKKKKGPPKKLSKEKNEKLGNKNKDPQAQQSSKESRELVGSRRKAADRPRS